MYIYRVIDGWRRMMVFRNVTEVENLVITADLVGRAYLSKRISRGRKQPLIL